jgi:parallel beta-helix repeat protein
LQACRFTRPQQAQITTSTPASTAPFTAPFTAPSTATIVSESVANAGGLAAQGGHGIVLTGQANLIMQNCTVTSQLRDGLHLSGRSHSEVVASQFIANGGAGIATFEQATLDVQQGHFEDNNLAAIYQSADEAALVSDTTFVGMGVVRSLEELSTDTDLQAFLEDLPAGSGVQLPAGEFYLERSLVIDKPLTLIGINPVTDDPAITPQRSDVATLASSNELGVTRLISRAPDALIEFNGDGALTLRNLSLEHVDSVRADIIVVNEGELILQDSFVGGAVSDGLVEIGGSGIRFRRDALGGRLSGNTIEGNAGFAVVVDSSASPTIDNNVIVDNGQGGVVFAGSSSGVLQNNHIARNGPLGVRVQGIATPLLEDNTIFDHSFNGLTYLDGAAGTARNNLIEVSGEAGVDVRGQATPLLEGNTIMESYRGIFYTANAAGTARGNTLLNNRGYGIYNASSAEPRLEDNQFEGNTPGDIGP